jgi:hypothetical protein
MDVEDNVDDAVDTWLLGCLLLMWMKVMKL